MSSFLQGVYSFMMTETTDTVGSLEMDESEIRELAGKSREFNFQNGSAELFQNETKAALTENSDTDPIPSPINNLDIPSSPPDVLCPFVLSKQAKPNNTTVTVGNLGMNTNSKMGLASKGRESTNKVAALIDFFQSQSENVNSPSSENTKHTTRFKSKQSHEIPQPSKSTESADQLILPLPVIGKVINSTVSSDSISNPSQRSGSNGANNSKEKQVDNVTSSSEPPEDRKHIPTDTVRILDMDEEEIKKLPRMSKECNEHDEACNKMFKGKIGRTIEASLNNFSANVKRQHICTSANGTHDNYDIITTLSSQSTANLNSFSAKNTSINTSDHSFKDIAEKQGNTSLTRSSLVTSQRNQNTITDERIVHLPHPPGKFKDDPMRNSYRSPKFFVGNQSGIISTASDSTNKFPSQIPRHDRNSTADKCVANPPREFENDPKHKFDCAHKFLLRSNKEITTDPVYYLKEFHPQISRANHSNTMDKEVIHPPRKFDSSTAREFDRTPHSLVDNNPHSNYLHSFLPSTIFQEVHNENPFTRRTFTNSSDKIIPRNTNSKFQDSAISNSTKEKTHQNTGVKKTNIFPRSYPLDYSVKSKYSPNLSVRSTNNRPPSHPPNSSIKNRLSQNIRDDESITRSSSLTSLNRSQGHRNTNSLYLPPEKIEENPRFKSDQSPLPFAGNRSRIILKDCTISRECFRDILHSDNPRKIFHSTPSKILLDVQCEDPFTINTNIISSSGNIIPRNPEHHSFYRSNYSINNKSTPNLSVRRFIESPPSYPPNSSIMSKSSENLSSKKTNNRPPSNLLNSSTKNRSINTNVKRTNERTPSHFPNSLTKNKAFHSTKSNESIDKSLSHSITSLNRSQDHGKTITYVLLSDGSSSILTSHNCKDLRHTGPIKSGRPSSATTRSHGDKLKLLPTPASRTISADNNVQGSRHTRPIRNSYYSSFSANNDNHDDTLNQSAKSNNHSFSRKKVECSRSFNSNLPPKEKSGIDMKPSTYTTSNLQRFETHLRLLEAKNYSNALLSRNAKRIKHQSLHGFGRDY